MKNKEIKLSVEFKTQATKAIFAIIFFIITYLTILIISILLTVLCVSGGIFIIALKPMFITIALGLGLASMGVLILIFLLKFIFKSHKIDRSHLLEITAPEEPILFDMINEIVMKVGTSLPKKVYLSSEVNASVFYDSSFWSMFLPVKKNLQIGIGLVNTVTKEELKAILCHEFGHFSQRTMKVGSYVYNVNQVIFNLLYDNESYNNLAQKWANVSGYFSIFVAIAIKINEGIQSILKILYEIINKSYMGLSREMEFHADEISASITGHEPLKFSLLRMELADSSFDNVLNFYNDKLSDNLISENLYSDQTAVIHFISKEKGLNTINNLPYISLENQSKFNKSKIVIKDQWASHPTIDERINRLEKTGYSSEYTSDVPANNIFSNIIKLQIEITNKIFKDIQFHGETKLISSNIFIEQYKKEVLSNSFSKFYLGYYDNKDPVNFDLTQNKSHEDKIHFNELYSEEKVNWVYSAIGLQNDINTLINISANPQSIKTFDYDGIKYKLKNTNELIEELKIKLDNINKLIEKNDIKIYKHFTYEEKQQLKTNKLEHFYSDFFEFDKIIESKYYIYTQLLNELQFTSTTTPYEQIIINFNKIKPLEEILKQEIINILSDNICGNVITPEQKHNLELYTSKTWEYFGVTIYLEENLNILYTALHNYASLLSRKHFLMKKRILTYQEELINNHTQCLTNKST